MRSLPRSLTDAALIVRVGAPGMHAPKEQARAPMRSAGAQPTRKPERVFSRTGITRVGHGHTKPRNRLGSSSYGHALLATRVTTGLLVGHLAIEDGQTQVTLE